LGAVFLFIPSSTNLDRNSANGLSINQKVLIFKSVVVLMYDGLIVVVHRFDVGFVCVGQALPANIRQNGFYAA
jgi:hypothetical protein